ncbi:MAG: glycosyltransferase family 4 protein [Acidimicrobiales bacterium]
MIELVDALGAAAIYECWFPEDINYPNHYACKAVAQRGIHIRHLDFPVFRRDYLTPRGVLALGGRTARFWRSARSFDLNGTTGVYLTTSAVIGLAPIFKRLGLRVVLHVHETWGTSERRLLSPFLASVDKIITVSHDVAARIPRASTVIYNGFSDPYEVIGAPPFPSTARLEFLLASRWLAWKGHEFFLRAWKAAALTHAHLTIVGGFPPSGEAVDVAQVVQRLGLNNQVTVAGEHPSIEGFYGASHVLVVPSTRPDPLPTVAIEAARAGRPSVGSDLGGIPEIVSDPETGWLLPPEDISAWASVLNTITPQSALARGRNARAHFVSHFSRPRFHAALIQTLGSEGPD